MSLIFTIYLDMLYPFQYLPSLDSPASRTALGRGCDPLATLRAILICKYFEGFSEYLSAVAFSQWPMSKNLGNIAYS